MGFDIAGGAKGVGASSRAARRAGFGGGGGGVGTRDAPGGSGGGAPDETFDGNGGGVGTAPAPGFVGTGGGGGGAADTRDGGRGGGGGAAPTCEGRPPGSGGGGGGFDVFEPGRGGGPGGTGSPRRVFFATAEDDGGGGGADAPLDDFLAARPSNTSRSEPLSLIEAGELIACLGPLGETLCRENPPPIPAFSSGCVRLSGSPGLLLRSELFACARHFGSGRALFATFVGFAK